MKIEIDTSALTAAIEAQDGLSVEQAIRSLTAGFAARLHKAASAGMTGTDFAVDTDATYAAIKSADALADAVADAIDAHFAAA